MTGVAIVADWATTQPVRNLLGPAERQLAAGFPDWRGREWTAARLTARAALRVRFGILPVGLEILPDEHRAPRAVSDGRSVEWSLSIAHSGSLVACLVDDSPSAVGIDVERRDPRNAVLAARITAPGEPTAEFTELWACKEAAIKACRCESFRGRDYLVRLSGDRADVVALRSARRLYAHLLQLTHCDAVVAAVMSQPSAPRFQVMAADTVLGLATEPTTAGGM